METPETMSEDEAPYQTNFPKYVLLNKLFILEYRDKPSMMEVQESIGFWTITELLKGRPRTILAWLFDLKQLGCGRGEIEWAWKLHGMENTVPEKFHDRIKRALNIYKF